MSCLDMIVFFNPPPFHATPFFMNLLEILESQTYKEQLKCIVRFGLSGKEYMLMFNHSYHNHV